MRFQIALVFEQSTVPFIRALFIYSFEYSSSDFSYFLDVELDPVAELAVREIISDLGLVVVGWYHSHPLFRPDPSVTDINNQHQYQTLMRDEKSGLEPFIGLIVSTFDTQLPSVESHHQWFHTRPYSDGTRGKKPVPIPMLLETTIGTYIDENQNVNLFLDSDQSEALVQKVINLTDDSTTSNTVKNTNGVKSTVKGIEKEENSVNINYSGEETKHCTSHHNESHDDNADEIGNDGNGYVEATGNSIKTMISFRGAGGSEYLGMTNNANDSNGVDENLGAVSGKRKYVKKSVVAPDTNATERRSGRETKAPTLFVPEKEKKLALQPPSLPVNPPISHIPPEIATSAKMKSQKISKNMKVLSKKIVASHFQEENIVNIPGRKKNLSNQIGSMDKWLKAGGEIITQGPILNAKRGIRVIKKENELVHKEVIKVNQRGKSVQEVKIDADILESKKRHGPGARGSKSMLKIPNRVPLAKVEVPSSSSSATGKRKHVPLTSKWLDDLERTEPSSSSSSSSSLLAGKRKNVALTSKWLDDLGRTEPFSSSSSSSSALPGKRKKIPNTSKWLDDFENDEPSPAHKTVKGKKGIKSKTSPKKTLTQKFDLSNIESIIYGNNKKQSATSKAVVSSIGTAGVKRKKGVISVKEDLFCDEIIMQKIKPPAPVKKAKKNGNKYESEIKNKNENEFSNENDNENDLSNETEDDGITLLTLLQGTSESAERGRKLICSVHPTHRCIIVGIVGLGFYYSTHPRRMNLNAIWRDEIIKFDKVKGSITYWASKLNISLSCQVRLIADISEFLIASWLEGDKKIQIIPEKTEKKKKSSIDTIVPGSSHVTKGGTVIIYKEDDGKDDEPKKRKKKKIFKK